MFEIQIHDVHLFSLYLMDYSDLWLLCNVLNALLLLIMLFHSLMQL